MSVEKVRVLVVCLRFGCGFPVFALKPLVLAGFAWFVLIAFRLELTTLITSLRDIRQYSVTVVDNLERHSPGTPWCSSFAWMTALRMSKRHYRMALTDTPHAARTAFELIMA